MYIYVISIMQRAQKLFRTFHQCTYNNLIHNIYIYIIYYIYYILYYILYIIYYILYILYVIYIYYREKDRKRAAKDRKRALRSD